MVADLLQQVGLVPQQLAEPRPVVPQYARSLACTCQVAVIILSKQLVDLLCSSYVFAVILVMLGHHTYYALAFLYDECACKSF